MAFYFHDNAFVMQFIPMVLLLLIASFPYGFSQVSHSIMGKLFAVSIVLYYTRMNYLYGLVSAIVFLIYYQTTEFLETFDSREQSSLSEVEKDKKKGDLTDDGTNLPEADHESSIEEAFTTKPEPSIITIDQFNDAKDAFIKEKCKNGVLMYKMMPVKNEMADHVYSEIKFASDNKCNPCDSTCDYNIIEAKMKTEESLVPKMSKIW